MKKTFLLGISVGILAGCAGREPVLEPTTTPWDASFNCEQLMLAHDDAINRAVAKQQLQQNKNNGDVALGIAGAVLFWPALFFIDTKNAEGIEAQNLMARASSLRSLAVSKECDLMAWKPMPELRTAQTAVADDKADSDAP